MFHCEQDLLANLIVLTPKLARKQFRQHIFEAWGWKCAYCAQQLTPDTATIDHILPKHKGGQNIRSNMACSCNRCNREKGSLLLSSFYTESNPDYTGQRFARITKWIEQRPCSLKLSSTEPAISYLTNDFSLSWAAT
jgi:hypothetical protein